MNITLYQISADLRAMLDNAFDPETGEALPAFTEQRALFGSKASAVAAYVLNVEADAQQCKAAIERIAAMKATLERKASHLRAYLLDNMATSGVTELKATDGSFVVKRYPERDKSVDVFDPEQLPDDYMREIPAKHEPDKRLIAGALDDGFDVPGARYVYKDRLTIK